MAMLRLSGPKSVSTPIRFPIGPVPKPLAEGPRCNQWNKLSIPLLSSKAHGILKHPALYGCLMGAGLGFSLSFTDLPEHIHQNPELYMSLIAADLGISLSLALAQMRKVRHLEPQAMLDPLTAALNKAHLLAHLDRAIKETDRTSKPFALVMVDLDHFKMFNDSYGHQVGDLVLKQLVMLLSPESKLLRETDEVGRFGGEEFAIILKNCDDGIAAMVCARILARISTTLGANVLANWQQGLSTTTPPTSLTVGATLGYSVYYPCGLHVDPDTTEQISLYPSARGVEDLIRQADTALYAGKNSGRGKIVQWTQSLENK